MANTIRLTVLTGPHKDTKYCFCGSARCLVGRGDDCFVQLVGDARDQLISRYHCKLVIDPPTLKIQDLGSRNGTFLNGAAVEKVDMTFQPCTRVADGAEPQQTVQEGDLLTIGGTTLRVDLVDCPHLVVGPDGQPGWGEGAIAKKECPLTC